MKHYFGIEDLVWIKPCIPTPQNLNKYKLSLTDELINPQVNVSVLLFYQSKVKRINLEESLAKILAQFYPLAGRYIKSDHLVDCSDQGAEFVEAEAVDVELIDLVGKVKAEPLNDLLPRLSTELDEAATNPLLSIQITEFKCGGLVIGISAAHKIFDASSVGTFIAAWSNVSNPGPGPGVKITISPSFDSPSLLPYKSRDNGPDSEPYVFEDSNVVIKKFSFNKKAITSLRSKLMPKAEKGVISRVRAVCALIAKAFISVDQSKYGKSRPCLISQAVNIRERTIPPLPKHSCGNLVIPSLARCIAATESKDMGIQELVRILGDAIEKTIADCAEILSLGEDGHNIVIDPWKNLIEKRKSTGDLKVVIFTDWSKFGFYDADFGSGKPVWTSIGPQPGENIIVLMDNKEGDGSEALVHLKPDEMSYFEQVEEIRLFTT